jgi:uncharacterized protein RhaS with RHS repeats
MTRHGHGDVTELTDDQGNTVASYTYDDWGGITNSTGSFANGWVNPYRYDGRDRVRYDEETGLYWMSVRAYDPALNFPTLRQRTSWPSARRS